MSNNGSIYNNLATWQAPVEEENPLVPTTMGGVAGDNNFNYPGTNTNFQYLDGGGAQQGGGGFLGGIMGNSGAMQGIGNIAGIIGAFGNVWSAMQSNKLAKKAFEFQKQTYNTNMANQIASYNTAIEDRANARAVQYDDAGYADQYTKDNSLKKAKVL